MANPNRTARRDSLLANFACFLFGFAAVVIGAGLSMTIVLLPLGVPLLLLGMLMMIWGEFGASVNTGRQQERPGTQSARKST